MDQLTDNDRQRIELIINSITEAYSMQPCSFYVGGDWFGTTHRKIAKIVQEDVYINGDPYDYYVGYDEKGNRLFEFKKGTVNVTYQ